MKKLKAGDRVAIVSPSWGGAGAYPERYKQGKEELEARFGVEVVAMENALKPAEWLYEHPQARADDIHQAFSDTTVKGIVASIGGEDAIRVIPYLDHQLIKRFAKPFMGYSDTTVLHLFLHKLGVHSFYGPALMAGFAEGGGMFSYTESSVRRAWFEPDNTGPIPKHEGSWVNTIPDFNFPFRTRKPRWDATRRKPIGGLRPSRGKLLGGCMEVLEFCRGTDLWPSREQWKGAILFLEIASGEKYVHPDRLVWFLRSLAYEGVLQELNGMLFGRPGQELHPRQFVEYEKAIENVLQEYECEDLTVLSRMEFGHTDPMFVLPYGVSAEVCPASLDLTILEDPLTPV